MSDLRRNIEYNVDQSSINKAKQELEKLAKKETELAGSILRADSASEEQLKSLRKVQKEQRDLASVLRVVDSSFGKQEKAIEQATSALDQYEERLRKVQRSGADLSGDFASSFGGLRGSASAFGGGQSGALGKGFEIGEAFADLGEFVPRLKTQMDVLGESMRGVDGNLGNTIAKFTGLSSGVSAFLTVAAPTAVVLGAAALAVDKYNKEMEAQRKQLEIVVNSLIDTNRQIAEGLTQDEAQAEIERLTRLREADADSLAKLNEQYASIGDLLKGELQGTVFEGLDGVVGAALRVFDSREQQIVDSIKETESSIQSYDASIAALTLAQEDGALAANDAAVAEENLAREREEATRQAEQAIARANQLQAQMDQIRTDAMISDANAAELEAAQTAIDNENARIREQEHRNALEKIAEDGRKRIEQIQAEMNGLGGKQSNDIAESIRKGNEKLADLEQEYQQSTIQKYEDFTDALKDAQDDASKTLRRLARDIKDTLTDATLENDVASFLKAQRDGEKRLKDTREDAHDQQKRMVDDFIKAQERERDAYMEKQKAIHEAIAQEKQQIIQAYQERRQALLDQIAIERQATQERLAQEAARHQQQLENEARRANQQAQLDAIRERHQQEAHNRRLQEIQQQRALELSKFHAVAAAINNIKIPTAGSSQMPIFKSGETSSKGGNNIFANINNQVSNVIGDVASSKEVEAAMNENNRVLMGTITKTIKGATSGRRGSSR